MAGFTLADIVQAANSFPDEFAVISGDNYRFERRRISNGGEAMVVLVGHWGTRPASTVNRLWAGCDNDNVYYYSGNSPTVTAVDQQPFPSGGRRKCRFKDVEIFNLLEPQSWPHYHNKKSNKEAREVARSHLGLLVKFAFLQHGAIDNISGKTDGSLLRELRDMCAVLLHRKVARESAARWRANYSKEEVAVHQSDEDQEEHAQENNEGYEATALDIHERYDDDRFHELQSQVFQAWRQLKGELEKERVMRRKTEKQRKDAEGRLLTREQELTDTAQRAKRKYSELKDKYDGREEEWRTFLNSWTTKKADKE
ncbi:hypothetical protein C7974DRAFT_380629 [Boeremia exigua]|uniref:uncharacterized protein n=1 Tax=Boeremia exigua TaxID=749465 RepID=UPI001E8DE80F|nr:uncharacterized protein C7974DRAFT_380629 [Boeremia exigua]KAH6614288.1 hypothetical protein C7974DRAFT_380629 [Boeremia exigua]